MAVRVTVTECVHSGEWSVGVGGGGSIPSPPRARGTEYNTTRGSFCIAKVDHFGVNNLVSTNRAGGWTCELCQVCGADVGWDGHTIKPAYDVLYLCPLKRPTAHRPRSSLLADQSC